MNITKENTGEHIASLTIEIAPEDFMPKVNESLEKVRKKANIPGFRPGKAPLGLVKRQYGKSIILEEVNQMAFEHIYQYVENEKLRIIGRPLINIEKTPTIDDLTETQSYSFVFDIGLIPEFTVNITPDIEVEYKKVSLTEGALEKEIKSLRDRHASFDKSDTVTNDCMVIGFLSIIDPDSERTNEDIENNKIYRYFFIDKLKENPLLLNKTIGRVTNDVIEILPSEIEDRNALNFLIPESTDLRKEGLKINFTVSETYTSKPADFNEEFYAKVFQGREINDEEQFREMLRDELNRHYKQQCDDIFLNDLKKRLVSDTLLPLPADFVKRFLIENNKEENEDKIKDLEERFDDYLEIIKWEFIQDRIFEMYEISIGIDDFKNYIRDFYTDYLKQDNVTDAQIDTELKQLFEDKKRMEGIEASIRRKKTLNILSANLTIKEVEFSSFEDMIEKDNPKEAVSDKPKKGKKTK